MAAGCNTITADKFARGSGASEPKGILTALAAVSPSVTVVSTTDGAFADVDVAVTWSALAAQFRAKATWIMSTTKTSQVRLNSKLYHASTVTLDDSIDASEILMGKQLVEMPYFPDWSATTGALVRAVVGDFHNFPGRSTARRGGRTDRAARQYDNEPSVADARPFRLRAHRFRLRQHVGLLNAGEHVIRLEGCVGKVSDLLSQPSQCGHSRSMRNAGVNSFRSLSTRNVNVRRRHRAVDPRRHPPGVGITASVQG